MGLEIHELNIFEGTPGANDYLATDNGNETKKISAERFLAAVNAALQQMGVDLNGRIDNIIAGGAAPSASEITDARLGASALGSKLYGSLGAAIRGQATELREDIDMISSPALIESPIRGTNLVANGYIDATTGFNSNSPGWKAAGGYFLIPFEAKYLYTIMPTYTSDNVGGIAFYDSSYAFISGVVGKTTGQASWEWRYIEIPENARYMKTCTRESTLDAFRVYYEYSTNTLDRLYPYIDIAKDYKWESGSIGGTGADQDFPGYFRTPMIPVKYNVPVNIQVGSNAVFIYEYNRDGEFVYIPPNGYVRYTEDAQHNPSREINYIRVVTRLEPLDEKATKSIVGNISVMTNVFAPSAAEERAVKTASENKKPLFFGMQMFKKIGVISDSISCGWALDKNGNRSRRNLDISWVQQMARRLGCTAYNLGASGVDPIEWFQTNYEFYEYCYPQYQSVGACDLYIIGLGLNGGTLGTTADINQSDYMQNAATFYGQYARIIQMINAEHPNAIVVCLTEPTAAASSYDQAVRNICALSYINAELVDLENDYFDLFNTPKILAQHQPDALHFTPYGYSLLAEAMVVALDDYISKHTGKFKYVGVATA